MPLASYLVTDELTVLLGLVAASAFLLRNLYKPQPLVHPILLGRQSDVSRVRNPGESAAYRNYGTGMMGRFPERPSKEIQVVSDFVRSDSDAPRTLWSTRITNEQLSARVSALGTGLTRVAGLTQESNVLLLLDDGLEFLLTDLALASQGIPSFTLSSLSLLSDILESYPPSAIVTHAGLAQQVLELVHDSAEHEHHTIIVVGSPSEMAALGTVGTGAHLVSWTEAEKEGSKLEKVPGPSPDPNAVFSLAFFSSPSGGLQCTRLTHLNLTAGVAATRTLLPLSSAISPLDTIVSAFSMRTPFGRSIAYAAINEGASFATLHDMKLSQTPKTGAASVDWKSIAETYPIPSPTILFLQPNVAAALTASVLREAKKSLWYAVAWQHKLAALLEGSVTRDGLWDRLVFNTARAKVLGDGAGTVRGVIVSGPLDAVAMTPTRIAFSASVVHAHHHPAVAGPVFASHPLDLQTFSTEGATPGSFEAEAHVGPPCVTMEVKLGSVDDQAVEGGKDPEGLVFVRGPSVGRIEVVGSDSVGDGMDGWAPLGERGRASPNGSFRVLSN